MNWLIVLLIVLYAINDYFIIESYSKIDFKKYWHYSKFLIVLLTLYLIEGLTWNLLAYYILYYVIFESLLNLLRKKHIWYVSKDGSFSDKLRWKLFEQDTLVYEGIIKILLLGIAIIILNR